MSDATKIEWTRGDDGTAGTTWNPVTGCSEVSEGCDHCYAKTFAERWRGVPGHPFEQGFDVRLWPDRLERPMRWRKPRRVFVNSMSDLFHDKVPSAFIASVFDVMARTPQHTYQILTKRHARMRSLMRTALPGELCPPLPNVHLGVSAEDQRWADLRVPALAETPAAVRFVSCEPLLGPIALDLHGIHWVIIGGESGPGARPIETDWVRRIVEQCRTAGVAVFVKQLGTVWAKESGCGGKGALPEQWPPDLRWREFPTVLAGARDLCPSHAKTDREG